METPEISCFQFPGMAYGAEYQTESENSLQPFEDNSAIINPNPQFCEAWNLNPPAKAPLPIAESCFWPGFQQTFGQRNSLMNQMAHPPNVFSQVESSGRSRTYEMPSHFTSNFNESDSASTNQLSKHYETSSEIPILAVQNAHYNLMDPIPITDTISPIHCNKSLKEFLPKDHLEPQDSSNSHAKRYSCSYCGRTFSWSSYLTRHIRTHTGEEPYKCMVCNKGFAENSQLTKHIRIHNRKKLHKCTECRESFVFRSKLQEHIRRIHTGKKLHKCEQCGKCFFYPSELRKHFSGVHTDDRPHKCAECGKCFAVRSSLKRHMLLHNKA